MPLGSPQLKVDPMLEAPLPVLPAFGQLLRIFLAVAVALVCGIILLFGCFQHFKPFTGSLQLPSSLSNLYLESPDLLHRSVHIA